jgi:hypothetical protein
MATRYWIGTTTSFTLNTNWSPTGAPASNDVLMFNGSATGSCSADLGSSLTGVTIIVEPSFIYSIGTVVAGLATYLTLDGGTLRMPKSTGAGSPTGSPRILIDFGTGTLSATVDIESTGNSPTEAAYPPVQLLGSKITANITGGIVGFAVRPGESATLTSLKTGGDNPRVTLGKGVTLTSGIWNSGTIESLSDNTATTVRISKGSYTYTGTGAHTTLYVDGGAVTYKGSGNIGTLDCRKTFDASGNSNAVTVTNTILRAGFDVNVNNGVAGGIVFTNAIQYPDGMHAGKLQTPTGVKGTLVAI